MSAKDVTELIDELHRQGFTVRRTRNGHYTVLAPDGTFASAMASTPSDIRGRLNNIAQLRRKGFVPTSALHKKKGT